MVGKLSVLVLAAFVFGCTLTPREWYKPRATPSQFAADKSQCAVEASELRGGFVTDFTQQGAFDACMRARGWELRQKSAAAAAPSP